MLVKLKGNKPQSKSRPSQNLKKRKGYAEPTINNDNDILLFTCVSTVSYIAHICD